MKTNQILASYLKRKKSRYGYSMRTLASQLKVSPSFLSRIFAGKKAVPYPLLLKMEKLLDIEPEVFEAIRSSHTHQVQDDRSYAVRGANQVQTELVDWALSDYSSNSVLRNWYYLPILEFTTLQKYDGTAECIARHMNLALPAVEVAMREMIALKLMKQIDGRWVKSKKKMRWSSGQSISEIRRFHHEMMSQAQQTLNKTNLAEFERRLVTGITITTSPRKFKRFKKLLNEFIHKISNDLMDDDDSEVYHLGVQLFPLTTEV